MLKRLEGAMPIRGKALSEGWKGLRQSRAKHESWLEGAMPFKGKA